eukprot:scpid28280/ scgid12915/ 
MIVHVTYFKVHVSLFLLPLCCASNMLLAILPLLQHALLFCPVSLEETYSILQEVDTYCMMQFSRRPHSIFSLLSPTVSCDNGMTVFVELSSKKNNITGTVDPPHTPCRFPDGFSAGGGNYIKAV